MTTTGHSTTLVAKSVARPIAKQATKQISASICGLLCAGSALAIELAPLARPSGSEPTAPWHVVGLPEKYAKPVTAFDITSLDGKRVLRVKAESAYGNLVHPWSGPVGSIRFKWRLDVPLLKANIKAKGSEDIALKVCLSFAMPTDKIPVGERLLFKLAQINSPEPLPTATLCYIWDHNLPVGSEQSSPYTKRVRYIVLNSGEDQLKTWQEHQRNVSADFLKSFGEETAVVPQVTAIIIGADSDNTADVSLGYVADITASP